MICPVCGNEIHEGEKYCGMCGAAVVSVPEKGREPVVEKRKEMYNLDGIIGFGLAIPFVIMASINVLVFVFSYGGAYLGGNPLIYIIGMVYPLICLINSSGGMSRRRECVKGNTLTLAGFVINIVLSVAFLITFIITMASCIAIAA